jgi:quercetin dioxygenase-like cupin family protein
VTATLANPNRIESTMLTSFEALVARMSQLPIREERPHKFVRTGLVGNNQIRLMDLERGYEETGWCAKEHILYVLEGSLILYFDGETLELHAGDVANLPPGDRYRHRPEPAGERVRLLLIEPR